MANVVVTIRERDGEGEMTNFREIQGEVYNVVVYLPTCKIEVRVSGHGIYFHPKVKYTSLPPGAMKITINYREGGISEDFLVYGYTDLKVRLDKNSIRLKFSLWSVVRVILRKFHGEDNLKTSHHQITWNMRAESTQTNDKE